MPDEDLNRVRARIAADLERQNRLVVVEEVDVAGRRKLGSSIAGMPSGGGPPERISSRPTNGSGSPAARMSSSADGVSSIGVAEIWVTVAGVARDCVSLVPSPSLVRAGAAHEGRGDEG